MAGCTGIRTPVTGVAARNATDWATQPLSNFGLLHVFNPLSHAATINKRTSRGIVVSSLQWSLSPDSRIVTRPADHTLGRIL